MTNKLIKMRVSMHLLEQILCLDDAKIDIKDAWMLYDTGQAYLELTVNSREGIPAGVIKMNPVYQIDYTTKKVTMSDPGWVYDEPAE